MIFSHTEERKEMEEDGRDLLAVLDRVRRLKFEWLQIHDQPTANRNEVNDRRAHNRLENSLRELEAALSRSLDLWLEVKWGKPPCSS